ncbi:MAG: hypothetical protein CMJ58_05260 [Planctomycetaceae bacterium]|nr:hypothetical protein [Planctomycetaceae bacterium]
MKHSMKRLLILPMAAGLGALLAASAHAVDFNWNVAGPADWAVGTNWDPEGPPSGGGGNHAYINNGGTAEISADIADIQDIFVGVGTSGAEPDPIVPNVGTLNQTGGNTFQGTGSWMFVGQDGGNGTYNLSGGTQGKERLYIGRNGGTGTLNLSAAGEVAGQFLILGDGGGADGTANVTGGSVHTGNEIWVGNAGGTGELNQSSGVVESDTWVAIGRDSGTGVVNLSGDAVLRKLLIDDGDAGNVSDSEGSFIVVGGLGTGGIGTLNIAGEATVWSDTGLQMNETAGQAGVVNQSGGTVTLHDFTPKDFQTQLGQSLNIDMNGHGEGEYHLSGGVLNAETVKVGSGWLEITGGELNATVINVGDGGMLSGAGGAINANVVQDGGTTSPGNSPGTMTVTGNYSLNSGDLFMEIEGTGAGTGYDQLIVTGDVSLAGDLTLAGAYVASLGDSFTLIDNQGANAISGAFTGLAEGAAVSFNGVSLLATYVGGDGNDFVLTAVPEPATIALLATMGLVGAAWRRRR